MAPQGSSTLITRSLKRTPTQTRIPATAPMMTEEVGDTKAQEAVIATSPASIPLQAIVISGFPNGNNHLNFDLGDKLDLIFGAAICLCVSALATIALNFADGHTAHVNFLQCSSNGVQQMRSDNRFDFFHSLVSLSSLAAWARS